MRTVVGMRRSARYRLGNRQRVQAALRQSRACLRGEQAKGPEPARVEVREVADHAVHPHPVGASGIRLDVDEAPQRR